jgi:hypothetical protein
MSLGMSVIKKRTMEVGFGYHLREKTAVCVGTFALIAGVLVIAPFLWGIGRLLKDLVGRYLASPG